MCRRGERKACNHIVLWIFLSLRRFDITFDVTLRDDSSYGKLTNWLRKSIFLSFPGSLKTSSSSCCVLFSSEEKYFGAQLLFHKKRLWKHSPAARVPTAFLVLPKFHPCFYNSIETRKTCFIYLLENTATRKRKTTF